MIQVIVAAAMAVALLASAGPAAAQDRPSEDELFGAPQQSPQTEPKRDAAEPAAKPGPDDHSAVEDDLFGRPAEPPAAEAAPAPPGRLVNQGEQDPLSLGGQLYLRAGTLWNEEVAPADWPLSSSNLLDLYADARPNDRVRAFVLGRMFYDPTVGAGGSTGSLYGLAALGTAGAIGAAQGNPRAVLDQLWINFDVGRRGFVTAGRQHVKWGVGKFWNPTDYLHPVKRNPLAVFDDRVGTTMVRLHVPWEREGWNAYAVAVLEDITGAPEPTARLGRVGAGGRVEAVLGTFELGVDALAQDGAKPRLGVDLSAGVWDLDLYGELALQSGSDAPRWRQTGPLTAERDDPDGLVPRVVLGGSYGVKYSDDDTVLFGAEWFWQEAGYEDEAIYPILLAGVPTLVPGSNPPALTQQDPNAFRPFYMGKQYAGAFASLPAPGSWNDTTFTLSVLGNLSDRSFVARLDHSLLALTYLRVETYLSASFGNRGGEFRFAYELDQPGFAPVSIPAPVLQAGVAIRVAL